MIKYTKVFPPAIKPFHIGVYMVSTVTGTFAGLYSKWNGAQWLTSQPTPQAAELAITPSIFQQRYWRGVLK